MAAGPRAVLTDIEDGNIAFLYKLPEVGFALRSVKIKDGVPEITFEAVPKVPTLTEEDFATGFRCASEGTRPGFAYISFHPLHPLRSRWYMDYRPAWLRWTGVGELLADADRNMKGLCVGARTDETKKIYKSWPKSSKLVGLRTSLDFPTDPESTNHTIWMSCEGAEVKEYENEILFPSEPKIQIKDGTSPSYSEYITQMYPSIAYHDEPKFLKVQEVIKLILAVEWLWGKGIRVNKEWMLMHTSQSTENINSGVLLEKRKKLPRELTPKPAAFPRPTVDASFQTTGQDEKNGIVAKKQTKFYGFYDCNDASMSVFSDKGVKIAQRNCLKVSFQCNSTTVGGMYLPVDDNFKLSHFQKDYRKAMKEITSGAEETVSAVEDRIVKGELQVQITENSPCQSSQEDEVFSAGITATTKDDYDKILAGWNPNDPIRPEIPGVSDAIIPNVKSWRELITDFTVPMPRVWQGPVYGDLMETYSGGVSTRDFPVRRETMKERERVEERRGVVRDSYCRIGRTVSVRAQAVVAQGRIDLLIQGTSEFNEIAMQFRATWKKGTAPKISFVFSITNVFLQQKWESYKQELRRKGHDQVCEEYYHGTELACDVFNSEQLCSAGNCGVCGISSAGMDQNHIRKDSFQRFGYGFYLAPNSSKCHAYSTNTNGHNYKAMLLCNVLPGEKHLLSNGSRRLARPPQGCDSVYGVVGSELNYPELVVYNSHAVLPTHIIGYQ